MNTEDSFLNMVHESLAFLAGVDTDDLEFEFRDHHFLVFGEDQILLSLLTEFRFNKGADIVQTVKRGNNNTQFKAFSLATLHEKGNTLPDMYLNLDAMVKPLKLDGKRYSHAACKYPSYHMTVGPDGSEIIYFSDADGTFVASFGSTCDLVTVRPLKGKNGGFQYEDYDGVTHTIEEDL